MSVAQIRFTLLLWCVSFIANAKIDDSAHRHSHALKPHKTLTVGTKLDDKSSEKHESHAKPDQAPKPNRSLAEDAKGDLKKSHKHDTHGKSDSLKGMHFAKPDPKLTEGTKSDVKKSQKDDRNGKSDSEQNSKGHKKADDKKAKIHKDHKEKKQPGKQGLKQKVSRSIFHETSIIYRMQRSNCIWNDKFQRPKWAGKFRSQTSTSAPEIKTKGNLKNTILSVSAVVIPMELR